MPEAVVFRMGDVSPATARAVRKLYACVGQMDLREGSRRLRRWKRVADRNSAVISRELAVWGRENQHFVDEREPRLGVSSLILHPSSFGSKGGVS